MLKHNSLFFRQASSRLQSPSNEELDSASDNLLDSSLNSTNLDSNNNASNDAGSELERNLMLLWLCLHLFIFLPRST